MANLKNRRETWYARIRMVTDGRKTEKQIPLRTKIQHLNFEKERSVIDEWYT